jgi:hypothetical protein
MPDQRIIELPPESTPRDSEDLAIDAEDNGTRRTTISALLGIHEVKADPHPQYLTEAEGDARYEPIGGGGGDGGGVPPGGTIGQVLTKNSPTDGDAGWKNVGEYPIQLANGGTRENTAIQVLGQTNEGIYYNPAALNYNSLDHPAWLTSFDGKSGPGIFDFGIWLPIPPISSNPSDPSSAGYLLYGPLVAGAGLWFHSTFRVPGTDAPGKKHSWWGLNWIADGGTGTPEKWISVARDYPAQPLQPGFNWPEASRNYIDLASQRPAQVVIPNGTLDAPGLVHGRNFFHAAAANTGWASLAENEFSAICEGIEVMRFTKDAVTNLLPEDWGTAP